MVLFTIELIKFLKYLKVKILWFLGSELLSMSVGSSDKQGWIGTTALWLAQVTILCHYLLNNARGGCEDVLFGCLLHLKKTPSDYQYQFTINI